MRPRDSKNQQNQAFLNAYLFRRRRVAKQPRFCESSAHQQTYTSGEELSFFSGGGGVSPSVCNIALVRYS